MKYNKLVRDKIPEIIKQKGTMPVTHIASESEYWQKLKEKLQEEVSEFLESESIEEIADILEVLEAIYEVKKFSQNEIQKVKEEKVHTRGSFKNKIILEETL